MNDIVLRFNDFKYYDLFEEIESGIKDDTGTIFIFTGKYYVFAIQWEEKVGATLRPATITCNRSTPH